MRFAVIGDRSKDLKQIFDSLNSSDSYTQILASSAKEFIKIYRDLKFSGATIFAPFDTSIVKYLDRIDKSAKRFQSVDTIATQNEEIVGYNFQNRQKSKTEIIENFYLFFAGKTHKAQETLENHRKNIISLIGFMGAGKTTISKALKIESYDLDFLVEKKQMLKIYDIFDNFGEKKFRQLETEILMDILKNKNNFCLSTGGGVILTPKARDILKKYTKTIFLYLPVSKILERVENTKKRPLFVKNRQKLEEIFQSRLDYYLDTSDILIDVENKSIEEIAKMIYF